MTPTVLPVPLSVLDPAPVGTGSDSAEALRASLDLVQEAERLATAATGSHELMVTTMVHGHEDRVRS